MIINLITYTPTCKTNCKLLYIPYPDVNYVIEVKLAFV